MAAATLGERAGAAAAKGIELALEGEAKVPASGHAGLAGIAIGNLLDNAIRYSPARTSVTVVVAREQGVAVARVRDQGPGIPAAERERALQRFTRLEAEGTEGSGLGLSIVRRVAELHGGTLRLGDGPGGTGLEAALALGGSGSARQV